MDKIFFSTLLITLTTVMSKPEGNLAPINFKSVGEYTVIYTQKNSTLGPHHKETQVALNNLAQAYKIKGDFDTALKLFKELFEISKKVYGEEDIQTTYCRQDVADVLLAQGKNLEAMNLFKINYKIRQTKLGPSAPATLDPLLGMANVNLALENYVEAINQYQQVYEGRKIEFGTFHDQPIKILDGLAMTLALQSEKEPLRWNEAVKIFEIIYEFRQKTIKTDDHGPDTIFSLNSVADHFTMNGDHEKAYKILEILYRIQSQLFPPKELKNGHQSITQTLIKMSRARLAQKRYQEALQILTQQALPEFLRLYPNQLYPDHKSHLEIMDNIAHIQFESGDLKEAAKIYGQIYDKVKNNEGLEHPLTVTTFGKLFQVLQQQQDYPRIASLATEIFEHVRQKYGEDHEKTVEARHDLATTIFDNERLEEALELFEQNLKIQVKKLGRHHEDTKYSRSIVKMVQEKIRLKKIKKRKDGGKLEL